MMTARHAGPRRKGRRDLLRALAAAASGLILATPVALARPAAPAAMAARPNVIILLADDLGYGDLGVQGGRDVATPNIDRLAAQGVRLTDYYANHPVCAPSRAALMMGRYQQRFGFENNPGQAQRTDPNFGLPKDAKTLPERLKAEGYATAMFGKWHLGWTAANTPTARGFETFYGFLDGSMAYTPDGNGAKNILRGDQPAAMPAYTTDAFADEAVAFIGAHKDKPFFIYQSFNAVHAPLQATDRYLARFAEVKNRDRRTYLAMLAALDDAVGRITAAVDDAGLGRRTLIVFVSDNGGPTWQTTSANTPLNGVKGLTLEGGIRAPAIFRWTGALPQGRVVRSVAMEFDVTATTLAVAGAPRDAGDDGVDLRPYLTGARTGDVHRQLFWRAGPQGAMREGPWKLVKAEDAYYLFDLQTDLGEHHDLAAAQPERLARMESSWQAWSDAMAAARWGPLNATGSAEPGRLRALVEDYIHQRPANPRALLYGGGPE